MSRPRGLRGVGGMLADLADLAVPLECAGCGLARVRWCASCADRLSGEPRPVRTRAELTIPVWALAGYGGPPARAVTAYKDRGRADLAAPLGSALAAGVDALRRGGALPWAVERPLVLVPVPAAGRARRSRGFDHVRRLVAAAASDLAGGTPPEPVAVAPLLGITGRVRDSSGLDARRRGENLRGHVRRRGSGVRVVASPGAPSTVAGILHGGSTVVLVDDVVTTGSTLAACVSALGAGGLPVDGALCLLSA